MFILLATLDPEAHDWWALPIPTLNGMTPNAMWEQGRYTELYEHVLTYLDLSFS